MKSSNLKLSHETECPSCNLNLNKSEKCQNQECVSYNKKSNWCEHCQSRVLTYHNCKNSNRSARLFYRIWLMIDGVKVYHVVNRTMGFSIIFQSPEEWIQKYYGSMKNPDVNWLTQKFFRSEPYNIGDDDNCGAGFQLVLDVMKMIKSGDYQYRGVSYKGKPNFTEMGFESVWNSKEVPATLVKLK